MSPRRKKPAQAPDVQEQRRQRQREICAQLLERWVPIAAVGLALRHEGRGGPVIDEEPLEAGLKAGAYVLKLLERLAKLDGLDAAEKRELTVTKLADPVELARRIRSVSPVLMERLKLSHPPLLEAATGELPPGSAPH